MPYGSKTSFTKNAYIGKANIPGHTTTNYDMENTTIKGAGQETDIRQQTTTTGANATSQATNSGKIY